MPLESPPSHTGNRETWILRLAYCETGQTQSLFEPQFLLQINEGLQLKHEGPSISDFCITTRLDTQSQGPFGGLQTRIFLMGA